MQPQMDTDRHRSELPGTALFDGEHLFTAPRVNEDGEAGLEFGSRNLC